MDESPTIQLKDFCKLFRFEDRQARFVLEQGFVPKGVLQHPCTGNRRQFGPRQAFWLAIVLQLKKNGMKTSAAVKVADIASEGVRLASPNLTGDWIFSPLAGWFGTDRQYYLDVGDFKYVRLVTDAKRSVTGLREFPWQSVRGPKQFPDFRPFVTMRLDLTYLASALAKVEGWSCPYRTRKENHE